MRVAWLTLLGLAAACSRGNPPDARNVVLGADLMIGPADTGMASFNLIAGLAETPDGYIAVLDHQVQELRIFDTTGRFLRMAGRKGSGPAEFTQATGLGLDPRGRIWVIDPPIGRFSVFSSGGVFQSDHTVSIGMWGVPWQGSLDSAGRVYDIAVRYEGAKIIPVVRRFTPDLDRVDTLMHPDCRGDFPLPKVTHFDFKGGGVAVPFLPQTRWVIDAAGQAWCASSDTYRIIHLDLSSGDTLAVVTGTRKARPLNAQEMENAISSIRSLFGDRPPPLDETDLPAARSFIQSLARDRQGRLWVQIRSEGGDTTVFDILDPVSGARTVATVGARIEGNAPRWFTATHVLMVALTEDDVPYVMRLPLAPSMEAMVLRR